MTTIVKFFLTQLRTTYQTRRTECETAVKPNWQRITHLQKSTPTLQRRMGLTHEIICRRSAAQRTLILRPEQEESLRKTIIPPRTLRSPNYRQSSGHTPKSNINPARSSKTLGNYCPMIAFPKRNASPKTLTTPASPNNHDSSRPKR